MSITPEARKNLIKSHFEESARVKAQLFAACVNDIESAALCISESFRQGGKLLLCGNGGSAADCQHLAAEFVSRLTQDFSRPGLPAIALTTDSSFLTAYANDIDYVGVFERQVQALGKPGDVLLGISTSGNSGNVVKAIEYAKAHQIKTIGLCADKGKMLTLCDVSIKVPSKVVQHIQESHLAIYHVLCAIVERELY